MPQSVASSSSSDRCASYVSPPTSAFYSDAGNTSDRTRDRSGNKYLQSCISALSEHATTADWYEPSLIDPQIFSENFVQQSHIDVPHTGDQSSEESLDFDLQMVGDLSELIGPPPEASPEIRVEDMKSWLHDTYYSGENISLQQLSPQGVTPLPQPPHLKVPYRSLTGLNDDQRSNSSLNGFHNSGSSGSFPGYSRPTHSR